MINRRVLHRPDTEAVEPIVVVGRINASRIEVQVVPVSLRVKRCTPVVPVRASVVKGRTVAVARGREEAHAGARLAAHADEIQYPSDGRCGTE